MNFPYAWKWLGFGCEICLPPLSPMGRLPNDQAWSRKICHMVPDSYVVYRSSFREYDIRHHVFRFDSTSVEDVFQNGFEARRQEDTSEGLYCDLEQHVNSGGTPLDSRRATNHIFISTTISSGWRPSVIPGGQETISVYRYEIYAPGGIEVAQTLGGRYRFPRQDEITFIQGIAPQYIRSAQRFNLVRRVNGQATCTRADTILYINRAFNPYPQGQLVIDNPVSYYMENGRRVDLDIQYIPELPQRRKRTVDTADELTEYYTEGVLDVDHYIDAAFRSTQQDEAYIFVKKEYVLINYAPGATDDWVVNGPHLIGDSFPSLVGTAFAEYGMDAAFGCHGGGGGGEAFIFSGNLCARISYAPGTTGDRIIQGPKTIKQMFPCLDGTGFEDGIDAAFESTRHGEAYLFRGSEYALLRYHDDKPSPVAVRPIANGFPCLRGGEFERDIGAAFASHQKGEAYLFKGNSYVLLQFTPGKTGPKVINGPKEIVPVNWPSLRGFLPRKNGALYVDEFHPAEEHVHDEL